ncbi:hypothetical protein WA026_003724 [Henosepilachna vigintioctopunctata]|uniref:ethanolamine kinase n=1 Tax=Henosepilachna vigintioctopunctata TaxID=420089 RepID=A0AAW1UD54_9CUCU
MNSTINNNDVLQLKITISDDDNTASILETVSHVRPYWNTAKIKFKLLTDGITNKLILCSHSYDGKKSMEYLLIRIYGNKTDLLIDRTAEIRNIKLLQAYYLAPQLYATLENGLVYEYLPGRTVSPEDVIRPEIYSLIAVEMAKMHKVRSPDQPKPAASLWAKFQQFVDLIPEEFEDITKQKQYVELNFSKCQLLQEIRQFKEAVNDINMAVVFCHNDLLLGNIIYNEARNKVSFIDFEYACFNYQPFDIGNHFAEYAGVGNVDYSRYPKKSLQLDWLKYYLMEYKEISKVSEYEIEELYVQVNKFVLMSHLLWFSWALIQAEHSYIDFDFIKYAGHRLEEYFKRKSEFLSMKPSLPSIT